MRRDATVVSVDLQPADASTSLGTACVELEHIAQCLRCSRGQGCGVGVQEAQSLVPLKRKAHNLRIDVSLAPGVPIEAGQQVVLEIDDEASGSSWLWAVFGAYGMPLVGMLLATGGATVLLDTGADPASHSSELSIIFSAGAGLFAGLLAWRLSSRRLLQMSERGLCLSSARIVTS